MPSPPTWRRAARRLRKNPAAIFFTILLVISLSANLLANSRPYLLCYKNHLYVPLIQSLPGTTFGPQFLPTEADFSNPEIQSAIRAHGWAIYPPIPYSYDTIVWNAPPAPAPPSAQNWLGTDAASRDLLARLLYGTRLSLLFAFALTAAASAIAITAGAIQGYYGGLTDLLFQRFTEIWSGLPQFFLILILASLFAPKLWLLLTILLLFAWMPLSLRVRAEFFRARTLDYVLAAKITGVPDWQIMARHILPNAMIAVTTFVPFILAESITLLASLDFLGFGLPPGSASLGEIAVQAKDNPQAPWLAIAIFTTLAGLLILLVFLAEALRDAFDPANNP